MLNWTHVLIVCNFRHIQEDSAFNTSTGHSTDKPSERPKTTIKFENHQHFMRSDWNLRQTSPIKCVDTYCQSRWAAMKWHMERPKSARFASNPIHSSNSRLKMSQAMLQCNWSNQSMTIDRWLSDPTATVYHPMLSLATSSTPNPLANLVSMQSNLLRKKGERNENTSNCYPKIVLVGFPAAKCDNFFACHKPLKLMSNKKTCDALYLVMTRKCFARECSAWFELNLPAIELKYCCRAFVQRYVSSDLFSTDIANWSFK